jgi:ABC-2 type transport system ATP-binding protein
MNPIAGPDELVRVINLTRRFGNTCALEGVSFSIRRGEILGLIGPNGAGKTTLFECLGGVMPFEAGTIERPNAGAAVFYLPDGIVPWPHETVDWVQRYTLGFFGGRRELRAAVNRQLGLDGILDQTLGTLSKGQRKRALLSVGLLTPHEILLADEPFEGLDLRQTRETAALLREMAGPDRTLFLSIHQIAQAQLVCDRFLLLSGGRARGEGTLDELAHRSASAPGTTLEDVFLALT